MMKEADEKQKKNIVLVIVSVVLVVTLLCLLQVENKACRLIGICGVVLAGISLICFLPDLHKTDIKSFFHSTQNKVLLAAYLAALIVSSMFAIRKIANGSFITFTIIVFTVVFAVIGICMGLSKEKDIVRVFPLFLIAGLSFCLVMPVGEVPDEQAHMYTAYHVSNEMMGIRSDTNTKMAMRRDDADFKMLRMHVTDKEYENYLKGASEHLRSNQTVTVKSLALTGNDYLYLFPAAGITIGRVLHLNSFWTLNLGRLFNLLFVGILMTMAIEILPVGRGVMLITCMMPTALQQNMSYSYDAPINAFGMLVIAYSVRKIIDEEYHPSILEKILIVCGMEVLLMAKGHAYFLLALMPLIVWILSRKKLTQMQRDAAMKRTVWILLGILAFALILLFTHVFERVIPETHRYLEWADEKEGYTLWYLSENPIKLISMTIGTIRYQAGTYFTTFFGKWMGWIEINTGSFSTCLLTISLILTVLSEKNQIQIKADRVLCWIISIGVILCIFGGFLLTYTTLASPFIEGVQGRYLILPVTLLLITIAGRRKHKIEIPDVYYLYAVLFCAGLTLFRILAFYAGA